MPSAGFEPAIIAIERPQTYALDSAAIDMGHVTILYIHIYKLTLQGYP